MSFQACKHTINLLSSINVVLGPIDLHCMDKKKTNLSQYTVQMLGFSKIVFFFRKLILFIVQGCNILISKVTVDLYNVTKYLK